MVTIEMIIGWRFSNERCVYRILRIDCRELSLFMIEASFKQNKSISCVK